jgi:hypothetical protein
VTIERICWIVGKASGLSWETPDEWARKLMGRDSSRRIFLGRALLAGVLADVLNVSQGEIAVVIGDRHRSIVGRLVQRARKWRELSASNEKAWELIVKEVTETIAAERAKGATHGA